MLLDSCEYKVFVREFSWSFLFFCTIRPDKILFEYQSKILCTVSIIERKRKTNIVYNSTRNVFLIIIRYMLNNT